MPNVRTDQLANLLTYLVEHVVDQGRLARTQETGDHLALVTLMCGGWRQRWACACSLQACGCSLQAWGCSAAPRQPAAACGVLRRAACCGVRRPPRAGATAGLLRGSPTPRRQHTAQAQVSAAAARDRYSLYCPMPRAWVAGGRAGGRRTVTASFFSSGISSSLSSKSSPSAGAAWLGLGLG